MSEGRALRGNCFKVGEEVTKGLRIVDEERAVAQGQLLKIRGVLLAQELHEVGNCFLAHFSAPNQRQFLKLSRQVPLADYLSQRNNRKPIHSFVKKMNRLDALLRHESVEDVAELLICKLATLNLKNANLELWVILRTIHVLP